MRNAVPGAVSAGRGSQAAFSRAPPALVALRVGELLPLSTQRAEHRVGALKALFAAAPLAALRAAHAVGLREGPCRLRLTKAVRNVRLRPTEATTTSAKGVGEKEGEREREREREREERGGLCVPFTTCCAVPGREGDGKGYGDSSLALTGAVDGMVTLWDVNTCRPLASVVGCRPNQWARVRALATHPTAPVVFTATMFDHAIGGWRIGSSELSETDPGGEKGFGFHRIAQTDAKDEDLHVANIRCLAVDPNGVLLASTGDDATLRLWDVRHWGRLLQIQDGYHTTTEGEAEGGAVLGLAFHPDGSLLSTADWGGRVVTWDMRTGRHAFTTAGRYGGHLARATCVAWSPCGTRFASGGADAVIHLWDARMLYREQQSASPPLKKGGPNPSSSAAPFAFLGHEDVVTSLAFYENPTPPGREGASVGASPLLPLALVSTSLDHTLRLWDMDTGLCAHTLDAGVPLYAQCRPYRGASGSNKEDGNQEACSAASILGVGHSKYWFLWDVVSTSREDTFEAMVKDTDVATAAQHLEGFTGEHGHIPQSDKGLGIDLDNIRKEVDDDDDDEEEMADLMRNPRNKKADAVEEKKTNDVEDDECSDDEMAFLRYPSLEIRVIVISQGHPSLSIPTSSGGNCHVSKGLTKHKKKRLSALERCIQYDAAESSNAQSVGGNSSVLDSILFLVSAAEKFEVQGNLAESVKSDETALMLRKAYEQATAQEEPKEGPNTPTSTKKMAVGGLPSTLSKHATAVVLRCNRYAVAELQRYRYVTALFFLRKALFLTSENVAEVREATLREFADDPESLSSTDSEMKSGSSNLSDYSPVDNVMNKAKKFNAAETVTSIGENLDKKYSQGFDGLTLPPILFAEDKTDERIRLRAATFNNLGCLERQRGQLEASLKYFHHTLHLQLRLLNQHGLSSLRRASSPSDLEILSYRTAVASTCLNACNVLHILGRYPQAVLACERAVQTLRMCPIEPHGALFSKVSSGDQPPRDAGMAAEIRIAAILKITGLYNLGVSLRRRGESGDAESARLADAEAHDLCKHYGLLNQDHKTVEEVLKGLKKGNNAFPKVPTQPQQQCAAETATTSDNSTKNDTGKCTERTIDAPRSFPASANGADSRNPAAPKEHEEPKTPPQDGVMKNLPPRFSATVPQLKLSLLQSPFNVTVSHSELSMPSKPFLEDNAASLRVRPTPPPPPPLLPPALPDPTPPPAPKTNVVQRPLERNVVAPPLVHVAAVPPSRVVSPPFTASKSPTLPLSATHLSFSSVPALPTLFARPTTPLKGRGGAVSLLSEPRVGPPPPGHPSEAPPQRPGGHPLLPQRDLLGRRRFGSIPPPKAEPRLSGSGIPTSDASLSLGRGGGGRGRPTTFVARREVERVQAARAKRLQEKIRRDAQKRQLREQTEHDTRLSESLYEEMVNKTRVKELQRCTMAAVQIQRVWRGVMAREWLRTVVKAVVTLQKVVRVFLVKQRERYRILAEEQAKLRAEQERRKTIACTIIQARARIFLRRLAIQRTILAGRRRHFMAARVIQRGYRDYLRRREAMRVAIAEENRRDDEIRLFRCKTALRCIWRAFCHYRTQKHEEEARALLQLRHSAAVRIQALVRGILTRAWFHYYRAYCRDQYQRSAISQQRLTVIQAACRALLSARYCRSRCLQLLFEAHQRRLNSEATRIQCLWRRRVAVIKFERLQAEKARLDRRATLIQRWYRMCLIRREFILLRDAHRRERAAHKIQTWLRACWEERKAREFAEYHRELLQKQRLVQLRAQSIVVLQAFGKARLSEWLVASMLRTYLIHDTVARTWQRVAQGYAVRLRMARDKELYTSFRRKEAELAIRTAAARIMQRAWRCALANMRVEQRRREILAASLIAHNYRIYAAKKKLWKLRDERELKRRENAARIIQQAYRGMLKCRVMEDMVVYYRDQQRKKILRLRTHEAATMIQAVWRGHVTRRVMQGVYAEQRQRAEAATRLQRAWRRRCASLALRQEIRFRSRQRQRRNAAAVRIQCFWRKVMAVGYAAALREKQAARLAKVERIQRWWRRMLAGCTAAHLCLSQGEDPTDPSHHQSSSRGVRDPSSETEFEEEGIVKDVEESEVGAQDESETSLATSGPQNEDASQHCNPRSKQAPFPSAVAEVLHAVLNIQKALRAILSQQQAAQRLLDKALSERSPSRPEQPAAALPSPRQESEEESEDEPVDPREVVQRVFVQRGRSGSRKEEAAEGRGAEETAAEGEREAPEEGEESADAVVLRGSDVALRAVLTLQRVWRGVQRRRQVQSLLHHAAAVVQRCWRAHREREREREVRSTAAAARQARVLVEDALDLAATAMQSAWRAARARRHVAALRTQREAEKARGAREEAAASIQRAFRAYAKKKGKAKKKGVAANGSLRPSPPARVEEERGGGPRKPSLRRVAQRP